ncbi:MAG: hypothetical protein WA667_11295 [Candidatus Nitrosopolaris sp.]
MAKITARSVSSAILSSILLSAGLAGIALNYIGSINNAYAQNNWYLGKGVQANTYYTYKIQDHDTEQGQPFIMSIYFKQFNSTGSYWIAPTDVVYQGKVYNGILHLSDLDLTPLGSSKIPPEMKDFVSGYKDSLAWLSAFVPKPGLSLTAPYWGKIAAIGGSAVAPGGGAKVTVPAGTFDTTVITWHYGVDNNLYVNPNMPYPVKAQTFAATTGGTPPIQFAFDLEATGQGQPSIPKSQLLVPTPPISIQTARGTYFIEIVTWQPPTITAGKPTQFGLLFKDNGGNVLSDVTYSVKTTEGNTTVADVHDQHASDGTGVQTITFPKPGPVSMYIAIDGVGGVPTGEFVESAIFNLVVA